MIVKELGLILVDSEGLGTGQTHVMRVLRDLIAPVLVTVYHLEPGVLPLYLVLPRGFSLLLLVRVLLLLVDVSCRKGIRITFLVKDDGGQEFRCLLALEQVLFAGFLVGI